MNITEIIALKRELSTLRADFSKMTTELEKVEQLEKSLAYHEIVLAKKVHDMNVFESRLGGFVKDEHLKEIKKGLRKVERHEDLLFEGSRYIKELVAELEKVRKSHAQHKEENVKQIESQRADHSEKIQQLQVDFAKLEELRVKRRKEIFDRIEHFERKMTDRMSQIEYQNKLIMKYLKRIDENRQEDLVHFIELLKKQSKI